MLWYFMEDKINHERIRPIRQMLLEMAVGNFSYRIQRSTADDEVESLILLLNMVAEELKSSFSHLSYVNPHNSYSSYVQASFIVDSSWIVKKISTDVSVLLGYSPKMLMEPLLKLFYQKNPLYLLIASRRNCQRIVVIQKTWSWFL